MTWEELRKLDKLSYWHIGDGVSMLERARAQSLGHWGRADQVLPDL